jgi:uncharacterized Zn-finger protein
MSNPAHDAPETEVVTTWKVACDGGEGALGHPRVWLVIPEETGWVDCGYCDKRYIHASAAGIAQGTPSPGPTAAR